MAFPLRHFARFALSALSLVACVAAPGDDVGTETAPIRGGTATKAFPAVGMIGSNADRWTCTATLLDATTLVTAAHCAFSTAPSAPAMPRA